MASATAPATCARCAWTEPAHDDPTTWSCDRFEAELAPRIGFPDFDPPRGPRGADLYPWDPAAHTIWLIDPGETWTAAYRLVLQHGDLVVAEYRVFPTDAPEADYAPHGEWSEDPDRVPAGGLGHRTGRDLFRPGRVRELLGSLLDEMRDRLGEERFGEYLRSRSLPQDLALRLMNLQLHGIDSTQQQQVLAAFRYLNKIADQDPHPVKAVAEDTGLERNRVRDLLASARRNGYLDTTEHGLPGGELTQKGEQLLLQIDQQQEAPG